MSMSRQTLKMLVIAAVTFRALRPVGWDTALMVSTGVRGISASRAPTKIG